MGAVAGAAAGAAPGAAVAGAAAVGVASGGVYTNLPGSAQGGVAAGLPALALLVRCTCAATLSCDLHNKYASTLPVCAVLAAASAALALASSLGGGNLANADAPKAAKLYAKMIFFMNVLLSPRLVQNVVREFCQP